MARALGFPLKTRFLVADDFRPWREQLRSILDTRQEWTIVGEACDGQEAVEKATEMQPDIIFLDVGMPVLNGIKAAKIICRKCPKSKILFVTQDADDDIRNAASRQALQLSCRRKMREKSF